MGQKINPIGNRLGVIRTWDSIWFAGKKNYAKYLHEDLKIRKYIDSFDFNKDKKRKKIDPGIAKIEIYRKPDRITVIVMTSKPGVVIGADGKTIQELTGKIAKMTGNKVEIKIKEVKNAEANAQLIADNIARQLKGRVSFRRAMKKAIADAKKMGVGGIRIQCSGRLGGADMARTEWYKDGRIPLHTFRADIDYGVSTSFTTYGTTGVKVWVFRKEILKRDTKEDAGKLIKKMKTKE